MAITNVGADQFSYRKSFINPYPRFKYYNDGGDPGQPLFLTDLIKDKKIPRNEIQGKAKVVGSVYHGVESYSGYLTVDKQHNSNMFFWYFPAEENPLYAPVVLWLQGGPGASSLFGLFTEVNQNEIEINRLIYLIAIIFRMDLLSSMIMESWDCAIILGAKLIILFL